MPITREPTPEDARAVSEKYDYDAAVAIMEQTLRKPLPPLVHHLLGEKNISRLIEILNSEHIKGIDAWSADGEISHRELLQYSTALPELQGVREELREVADGMMAVIRKNLEYKLSKSIYKRGNFNMKGLGDLFTAIDTIVRTFAIFEFPTTMFGRIAELRAYLLENIVFELLQIAEKRCQPITFQQILQHFDNVSDPLAKPRVDRLFQRCVFIFALQSRKIRTRGLDFQWEVESLGKKLPPADQNEEELKKENNRLLDEICDLTLFRRIRHSEFQTPHRLSIKILSEKESNIDDGNRFAVLFGFTITLENGQDFMVSVDRTFGEIRFNTSQIAAEKFFPPEIIERLKKEVFTHLAERLRQQEDEIEEFVDPSLKQKTPEETQEKTKEVVNEVMNEAMVESLVEAPASHEMPPYKPYVGEPEEPEKKHIDVSRFSGLSSREVKAKLDQLLGEPLRIRGSHHIYEGVNGCRFPIPFHSGKDISRGLLIKCLNKWGILLEFYQTLK